MAHPTLSPWLEREAGVLIQQGRLQEERGLGEDVWELCLYGTSLSEDS